MKGRSMEILPALVPVVDDVEVLAVHLLEDILLGVAVDAGGIDHLVDAKHPDIWQNTVDRSWDTTITVTPRSRWSSLSFP